MSTQERFNKLYSEVLEQIKNDVPYSKHINREPKLFTSVSALGKCQRKGIRLSDYENHFFTIYLNKYLENCSDEVIKNTICHELIHSCKGCFDHKTYFKYYAQVLKSKFGYEVSRTSTDNDFREFINKLKIEKNTNKKTSSKLYKVTCLECGRVVIRTRKININNYTCTCGGKLKIEEI